MPSALAPASYDQNGSRTKHTWRGNRVQTVDGQSQIAGYEPRPAAKLRRYRKPML
ncbi:hypothetical protein J2W34_004510 [Variovorax boronicumulans]|uniref:hypothetical protein n=1 Tax=Variovorax boronicumulans TaxID=436515 RepID=UPI00277EA33F|nr:hypothetical protein [Variovorax boronicumulans]MDQ0072705.1 hypothetical protein [Variovorax boronicumulans]